MQINSTQAIGLIAFLPATLLALVAARRAPRGGGGWSVIAAIHLLLALELFAGMRHRLSGLLSHWLRTAGVYADRRPPQAAVDAILVALAAAAIWRVARGRQHRTLTIARAATAMLLALFVAETVSLHAVDAIMYRPAGPVLLIGWLWLACGWTTASAAAGFRGATPARRRRGTKR